MSIETICDKQFANGQVLAVRINGKLIEITDTFLPYETKNASVSGYNLAEIGPSFGDRTERWMIGVSTMSGCPVRCGFCATSAFSFRPRLLTADEIVEQVEFITGLNSEVDPCTCKEFKINYTRMGEPFLNIANVRSAIQRIARKWPSTHHYVSTIGLKGSDFSWIEGPITLQLSLHSLEESRRRKLIPHSRLMSIQELGMIRTRSNLKTTINLTLVNEADFDVDELRKYFDPEHFFIKLSPINPNDASDHLGSGIIVAPLM